MALYIICGCMSLPFAASVWFLLQHYPHNTKAWYLTEEDKAIALRRNANMGKAPIAGILDLKLVKRMFGNWCWWLLIAMYTFYGNSCQANQYFSIYLRSASYSVTMHNIISACSNLVSMITDYAWEFESDLSRNRVCWAVGPLMGTTVIELQSLPHGQKQQHPRLLLFSSLPWDM